MKPLPKLRSLALFALVAAALAFAPSAYAPSAYAEDGPEAGGDLKKKIQEKMEKILQLMRENEEALLKLSTGKAAETRKVDVEIPDGDAKKGGGSDGAKSDGAEGASGSSGSKGAAGSTGEDAVKKMEQLLESVSKKGGSIPDEIKQLVEMIPL